MKKMLLALLLLIPSSAEAITGHQACREVGGMLLQQSILAKCEYRGVGEATGSMYAVAIMSTQQSSYMTLGFILSAIIGVDTRVPTKTVAVGVTDNSEEFLLYDMDQLRLCAKNFIQDDVQFMTCVKAISEVVPLK